MNGRPLDETAILYPGDTPSAVPFDIVVPDGGLWVMGDHRDDSSDSRDHLGDPGGGTVPVGRVIGRADWIGWPYGHWTRLTRPHAYAACPPRSRTTPRARMGNRGRPRGVAGTPPSNLLPTGARRSAGPAGGRTRAERRKLQRKVKRKRRRVRGPGRYRS